MAAIAFVLFVAIADTVEIHCAPGRTVEMGKPHRPEATRIAECYLAKRLMRRYATPAAMMAAAMGATVVNTVSTSIPPTRSAEKSANVISVCISVCHPLFALAFNVRQVSRSDTATPRRGERCRCWRSTVAPIVHGKFQSSRQSHHTEPQGDRFLLFVPFHAYTRIPIKSDFNFSLSC